jgi:hypothetical protein
LRHYADTGFIGSLYCADGNTPVALASVRTTSPCFLLTAFLRLEILHAFQGRVFRREWTAEESAQVMSDFSSDLSSGAFQPAALDWDTVLQDAAETVLLHGARTGTRTLDTLHVCSALSLQCNQFWSFDRRQRLLATSMGLPLMPPELP